MNAPHDPSPELAALLRLKRHEQPPPGYFEEFAHAFHERQRAELLRVSAWRLLVDRVGTHFLEWRFLLQPRWLMTTAAAATALAVAVIARPAPPSSAAAASARGTATASLEPVAVLPLPAAPTSPLRGTLPVSTYAPEPTAPPANGLRRTPGDALVPVAPSAQDGPSPQADHGKVIILVR